MQVPIFDGSASEWVEAIEQVGLKEATDHRGNCCEKMAAYVNEPVHVWRNDSFVAAFPSPEICITYGIDFRQVHILLDWELSLLAAWSWNVKQRSVLIKYPYLKEIGYLMRGMAIKYLQIILFFSLLLCPNVRIHRLSFGLACLTLSAGAGYWLPVVFCDLLG